MSQCSVHRFPAIGFLLAGVAFSCVAGGDEAKSTDQVSAIELDQLIKSGAPPVIIDVRSGYEYRRGHVPGARHMPFWKSFFLAGELSAPKDQPVIVYCQHGPRAVIAAFALRRAGFTDVRYLEGHMTGWESAGLPLETSPPD
jgi:rhodanese-related sulfurtransferase